MRRTAVVVLGCSIYLAHALYYCWLLRGHCVDDAYISFRYAANLAAGKGLVFNPGERVEGYSNLLWVLLHAPAIGLGWNPERTAQILGVACGLSTLLLGVRVLRRHFSVDDNLILAGAGLALAGSGYYAAWSAAGLETTLFAFLLLAAWYRSVVETSSRPRWPLAALAVVLLALTRPEGVFLALASVGLRLAAARAGEARGRWRAALLHAGLVGVALVLYESWRFLYFGPHLLPNSVRAKVGLGVVQVVSGSGYVGAKFLLPYLPLLLAVFVPRKPASDRGEPPGFASGYALLVAYLLFVAAVGGDWSHGRMFVPVLPLGMVLLGAKLGAPGRVGRERRARVAGAALLLAYLGVAFYVTGPRREEQRWRVYREVDPERIAIGKWLAAEMPPDAVLAVYAAGQIPFYSGLYAHDMLGLNDPHIAGLSLTREGAPAHEKRDPAYTLETVRPDIVVEGRLVPGLHQHPLWRTTYHPVRGFWKHQEVVMRREFVERLQELGKLPRGVLDAGR